MHEATKGVTIRDFLIFQTKLLVDGAKDVAVFQLSILAVLVDLVCGRGRRPRLFYAVLRLSERFDLWLNLHASGEGAEESGDGLFGASRAGTPTFLGQLEQWIRGGDAPRGRRSGETSDPRQSGGLGEARKRGRGTRRAA